jgi:putative transcriptional regulator
MYHEGKLLVAPPTMRDWRFQKSVVYLWKHDHTGASGVIINKRLATPNLQQICRQGNITVGEGIDSAVYYGGPIGVEIVGCLHTLDYRIGSTNLYSGQLGFTMDRKIIVDIAQGRGPHQHIITMGIASWDSGQLESEIEGYAPRSKKESWLVMDFDPSLIWHNDMQEMWNSCVNISLSEQSRQYVSKFFADQ